MLSVCKFTVCLLYVRRVFRKKIETRNIVINVPKTGKTIITTKYLTNISVKVEAHRKNLNKPRQCHNRPSFGNASYSCHAKDKCVKCGSNYPTLVCKKTVEKPPRCANCGGEHSASYHKCKQNPLNKLNPTNGPKKPFF